MLIAAQEFLYVRCTDDDAKKAPDLVHEARSQEAEIADRVAAAKTCYEKSEKLVEQIGLGVKSDLYKELDDELTSAVLQLASGVRIKFGLVMRQLEEARKLADACDEATTLRAVAEQLKDREEMEKQTRRAEEALHGLRQIQGYNDVLCRLLRDQHCNALELFDSLRR